MNTIYNLIGRWMFLLSETNRDQKRAYNLLVRITQWLNQNPDYNLTSLINFIIEWEEELLYVDGTFDTIQKQLTIQYCYTLMDINNTLLLEHAPALEIFTRDEMYYTLTLKVLQFLKKDYYTELELYDFLRPLRRKEYKQYNWKTEMLKA
jgi:hypothetical protein